MRQICFSLLAMMLLMVAGNLSSLSAAEKPGVVAIINGKVVTSDLMNLEFYLGQLPEDAGPADRKRILNVLADRELVRQFLQSKKIEPNPEVLDREMKGLEAFITKREGNVDEVLAKFHLTKASVRELLAVNAAWANYMDMVVRRNHFHLEWDYHRQEFDGTRVKASQIVFHVKPEASSAEWDAAEAKMQQVLSEIRAEKLSFAEAASKHSQSPSARNGGSMGEFEYHGRVDPAIAKVAFELMPGDISVPFRTRFGVHVVKVDSRLAGTFSMEDARGEMMKKISRQTWSDVVMQEREKATIQFQEN
ncbi:foldase protein PrsA [Planctomicrobium sp. SH527]|uniref:foldase protein PrsA n=1 Tax=Planctomicrobium sp. SH527 TaxID=3448123 RepID=UPI003F5BB78D